MKTRYAVLTTNALFEQLKQIIVNLPTHANSIDIHLDAKNLPTVTAVCDCLHDDGSAVLFDGPGDPATAVKTEVKRFKLVPIDEVEQEEETRI